MIIPVRCFTCGKEIASLWPKFKEEVSKGRDAKEVLDELGVKRYCCRSIFLTHVDLIERVARFKV